MEFCVFTKKLILISDLLFVSEPQIKVLNYKSIGQPLAAVLTRLNEKPSKLLEATQ